MLNVMPNPAWEGLRLTNLGGHQILRPEFVAETVPVLVEQANCRY